MQISRDIKSKYDLQGVSFESCDMLECDLSQTGILMMTSQCWDAELKTRAAEKLKRELPSGSIVIDYSSHLQEYLGEPVACCTSPVSWNQDQKFYVFQNCSLEAN